MKLKLYETSGESTRDLDIEGPLTEVLCVLDALSGEAEEDENKEDEFEFEIETSRQEWVEALVHSFREGEKIEVFGEEKAIYNYNWFFKDSSTTEHTFDFVNGDSIILQVEND